MSPIFTPPLTDTVASGREYTVSVNLALTGTSLFTVCPFTVLALPPLAGNEVGAPFKSEYLPVVATVDNESLVAYLLSELVTKRFSVSIVATGLDNFVIICFLSFIKN